MSTANSNQEHRERIIEGASGWAMLAVNLMALVFSVVFFIRGLILADSNGGGAPFFIVGGAALFFCSLISLRGHFSLQPNQAQVLLLFGSYQGTVRQSGYYWMNPFYTRQLVSLRLHNLEGAHLKVNDKRGNPIEIAAVIVWRVQDTFQAMFDVEGYADYVKVQSETAVRHLASSYAYDHGELHELTLRSSVDEVSLALKDELQQRLAKAGVAIEEARLTHLAYAPEIAGVMLRRQQAEAVIAARQMIVQGAVSMVQMALHELSEKHVVELDEARKAAMVSNLLVVLCGEGEVHPVVNAGS